MNLRGRITVIVSASFLAFVGLVLLEGRSREAAVERRLEENVLTGLRTAWAGLTGTERQRLLRHVERIRASGDATVAFVAHDTRRLASATLLTRTRLRADVRRTGVQAVQADGTPFFDTHGENVSASGPTILDPAVVQDVVHEARIVDGLFESADGELLYVLAAPVYGRTGVAGLLVLHTPAEALVAELADLLGARTILTDRGGHAQGALQAGERRLLGRLADETKAPPSDRVVTVEVDGRDLQVARMALSGPFAEAPLGTITALRDVSAETRRRELISQLSYFALACALVLFLAGVNWYLRRSFRPLNGIIRSLNALSAGRTDIAVESPTRDDEIGRLAGTFETFRQGIEARTRLSRLQQELDVAARIQRQSLPTAFPERPGLGFAARMQAARDVGGDFYDVFTLPDGRIACVIADVSGKGVGAALFMAAARTVIRTTAALAPDPADCLGRANDHLAAENAATMFVTVFYAVLDPASGEVRYCNAGHNPPAAVDVQGRVRMLEAAGQPALGVFDGLDFEARSLTLAPGERLFLYTDGIPEAMTAAHDEFGAPRMQEALASMAGAPAQSIVEHVLEAVTAFTQGAEQSDDITCLVIAYDGA